MNTFILSYNPLDTKLSYGQLSTFVKENRNINQWFQPFIGTYILKSNEAVAAITESFRGAFDGAPFVLSLANPMAMGGAQDQSVWDWINSSVLPVFPNVTKSLF